VVWSGGGLVAYVCVLLMDVVFALLYFVLCWWVLRFVSCLWRVHKCVMMGGIILLHVVGFR